MQLLVFFTLFQLSGYERVLGYAFFRRQILKFYLAKNVGVKVGLKLGYAKLCKINGVILYVKVHHKRPSYIGLFFVKYFNLVQ